MAFNLQEQEQIDAIKAFWQQWGKWVITCIIIVVASYLGSKGYHYYQQQEEYKAASEFEAVLKASDDLKAIKPIVARLQKHYARSAYTARAALILAKAAFDQHQLPLAKAQLEWVINHNQEDAIVALTRLRLASVLIDLKTPDAALAELNQAHPVAFDALFLDRKGDVFTSKGDVAAARDAYQAALAKVTNSMASRQLIEIKLDALGG